MGKQSSNDEEMTVTLELDEGSVTCAIYTILEVNGKDYIVLMPLDENGENKYVLETDENKVIQTPIYKEGLDLLYDLIKANIVIKE